MCTETLFNLKFTSKQLQRQSKKCEKSERAAKKKVEKVRCFCSLSFVHLRTPYGGILGWTHQYVTQAIKKGNMEGAKIYAAVRVVPCVSFSAVFLCSWPV